VIGHHVQPAWPVVLVQHMVDLVRERRGLYEREQDDDQRADSPMGRHMSAATLPAR
jgi:hypothetical protein